MFPESLEPKDPVLFIIQFPDIENIENYAINISFFSAFSTEEDVILAPGKVFEVINTE